MQFKRFLSISVIFLSISHSLPLFGQRTITGKVLNVNSKLPVENVAVTIFMGTQATTTNNRGFFQLSVSEGDSLVFTHPDYKSGGLKLPEADVFVAYMEQYHYYPEYQQGDENLYMYLQKNLKYPRKARMKEIEGLIFVEVKVDSTGSIVSCQAINELCSKCNDEILSVFQKIPGKWVAYKEPIIKAFIFPIEYRIQSKGTIETQIDARSLQGKLMPKIVLNAIASQNVFH